MVRAILVGVALSACAAGSAMAQGRPVGPAMAPGEAYVDIQALKAEIAELKQQMIQQKASYDNQLTDARFRIAALEASQKQGGTATQLQESITALTARTSTLEAHWSATSSALQNQELQLNTLSTQFKGHTHSYRVTTFSVLDGRVGPPIHMGSNGEELATSFPHY